MNCFIRTSWPSPLAFLAFPWERVLRDAEHTLPVCRYVVENPVRAKLVEHPTQYPLCGSTQYTIEEICEAIQIKGWWNPF
jgi:hypothetical protein